MHPERQLTRFTYLHDRRWRSLDAGRARVRSAAIGQEFVLTTLDGDLRDGWLSSEFRDAPSVA